MSPSQASFHYDCTNMKCIHTILQSLLISIHVACILLILNPNVNRVTGYSPHPHQLTTIPTFASSKKYNQKTHRSRLFASDLDDNNERSGMEFLEENNNFDGDGFANYLGPYAVAFVASIAVTAAFFKFILLDY
mmetsp:Transcript_13299/g.28114  ORF Transcript_13299/g.28114 Transcript_13299/m.28114 type:complete len:134 (-) Transcript_13299:406-807(-)